MTVDPLADVREITAADADWPRPLTGDGAPTRLWVRGNLTGAFDQCTLITGARASTMYGEHITGDLAGIIAGEGNTVLTGGGFGIDAAATRAALAVGGRAGVVFAGGLDRVYPPANRPLLDRVLDQGGFWLTAYEPGTVPRRGQFLERNMLAVQLCSAVVITEASLRGMAMATGRWARSQNIPLLVAPGPVTSAQSTGCHQLLREGATLAADYSDLQSAGLFPVDA